MPTTLTQPRPAPTPTPTSTSPAAPDCTPLPNTPQADFHSPRYLRNNFRRMEHLASLGLDLRNKTVLELGAGIGDLSTFFLDRACRMTITEGRPGNYELLERRYRGDAAAETFPLDLDPPPAGGAATALGGRRFQVVFCYGLLYHLSDPAAALDFMDDACEETLLLESIVSPRTGEVNPYREDVALAGAAVSGMGCRPSRGWVFAELRKRFAHVYVPATQPNHIEFPLDWMQESYPAATRSVFIASRKPIESPLLVRDLISRQVGC